MLLIRFILDIFIGKISNCNYSTDEKNNAGCYVMRVYVQSVLLLNKSSLKIWYNESVLIPINRSKTIHGGLHNTLIPLEVHNLFLT